MALLSPQLALPFFLGFVARFFRDFDLSIFDIEKFQKCLDRKN
jgi:hypothetical protein